jgi:predicted Zn-dependent protease
MRYLLQTTAALVLLALALVAAERNAVEAPVGAHSILYLVADSQRDLTRMPSRFTRIPDEDEVKFGDTLAEAILGGRQMTPEDHQSERELLAITERIAPHVGRRNVPTRIHFIPDRSLVNAFALPGGHVFFGAGLLEKLQSEDQVAFIVAHEVEHVDRYHCAERLQVEAALRKIPLGAVLVIPVAVFQAGYSKEQELEADREGVKLAASAGYSAQGALEAFRVFLDLGEETERAARTPQEELGKVTLSAVSGYFRSHPLTRERIAQVRAMISREPGLTNVTQRPRAQVAAPAPASESAARL